MEIIVNGKLAVIKQGSSFELVAENRMFTGSDAFSLSIEFPMKDCPRNLDIFGDVIRPEIVPENYIFDCELRDAKFSRFGSLVIIENSDSLLKAQFLEGRSVQNYHKSFDEIYVNDLDLGSFPNHTSDTITPEKAWSPVTTGYQAVALPWVSQDSGILHNHADYDTDAKKYVWHEDVGTLSWQPYLLHVVRKICEAMGYEYDLSPWEADDSLSKLLVCNTLPPAWGLANMARVLPHWSIAEFFEKLEIFLNGEFEIDHRGKRITFTFCRDAAAAVPPVYLHNVVDQYTREISAEDPDCSYIEARNISYKSADHMLSAFYDCDWYIRNIRSSHSIVALKDVQAVIDTYKDHLALQVKGSDWKYNSGPYAVVARAEDSLSYWILRPFGRVSGRWLYVFQQLNEFGPKIVNEDTEDSVELEFVPACLEMTEPKYGQALFVKYSSFSEPQMTSMEEVFDGSLPKSGVISMIEAGKSDGKPEYFNMVSLAFWDGKYMQSQLPHPYVSDVNFFYTYGYVPACVRYYSGFSMRLNDPMNPARQPIHEIDTSRKSSFSFIADEIPDPRAVFFIHGRRYICEKITATFSDAGMSQLLKGEFWPLND